MKAKELKPTPTTQAQRVAVANGVCHLAIELGVENLYVGFQDGVFYLEWGLFNEYEFAEGDTLDEAYLNARQKLAGTEPAPV